jgi:CheY-like chemotaxis protein
MRHVLLVEDDASLVVALKRGFEFEGYTAEVARDGEAALQRVAEQEFDVMILDVMLPKLSGFDVCQRLRNAGHAIPIIMLTARGQEIDKVLGLKIGADDYLTKPFSFMHASKRFCAASIATATCLRNINSVMSRSTSPRWKRPKPVCPSISRNTNSACSNISSNIAAMWSRAINCSTPCGAMIASRCRAP